MASGARKRSDRLSLQAIRMVTGDTWLIERIKTGRFRLNPVQTTNSNSFLFGKVLHKKLGSTWIEHWRTLLTSLPQSNGRAVEAVEVECPTSCRAPPGGRSGGRGGNRCEAGRSQPRNRKPSTAVPVRLGLRSPESRCRWVAATGREGQSFCVESGGYRRRRYRCSHGGFHSGFRVAFTDVVSRDEDRGGNGFKYFRFLICITEKVNVVNVQVFWGHRTTEFKVGS